MHSQIPCCLVIFDLIICSTSSWPEGIQGYIIYWEKLIEICIDGNIDMVSGFVNTKGILCGHSVLADVALVYNWSNMFWFYVPFDTGCVGWAVITIRALPLISLLRVTTFYSDHFRSYQVTKLWNILGLHFKTCIILFMLSVSVNSKGISGGARMTTERTSKCGGHVMWFNMVSNHIFHWVHIFTICALIHNLAVSSWCFINLGVKL